MNLQTTDSLRAALAATFTATTLALCGSAVASPSAEEIAQHRAEVAVCTSGASPQGRETCLREAGAAYAQLRRDDLNNGSADYAGNARQRCKAHERGDERGACLARMTGGGTRSGSVAGGGVLRELVTRSVEPPSLPAAAPQVKP